MWKTVDKADTAEGCMELRSSGPGKFVITIAGRVLMNGMAHKSELALATLACEGMITRRRPKILIGGLGMAFTLRAALDALPGDASIKVAELNPVVLRWCLGPLFDLTQGAVADPRVNVQVEDVAQAIVAGRRFDAIIVDLYEGPHAATQGKDDPVFGRQGLRRCREALVRDGVFAVWGEDRDPEFEKRIVDGGFSLHIERPGKGGRRHVVYIARPVG